MRVWSTATWGGEQVDRGATHRLGRDQRHLSATVLATERQWKCKERHWLFGNGQSLTAMLCGLPENSVKPGWSVGGSRATTNNSDALLRGRGPLKPPRPRLFHESP